MPVNEVRQILMNELGLTREMVREEAAKIIVPTVEAQVNSGRLEGILRAAVIEQFNSLVRGDTSLWYNNDPPLKHAIKRYIEEEIRAQIREMINVQVKLKESEQQPDVTRLK